MVRLRMAAVRAIAGEAPSPWQCGMPTGRAAQRPHVTLSRAARLHICGRHIEYGAPGSAMPSGLVQGPGREPWVGDHCRVGAPRLSPSFVFARARVAIVDYAESRCRVTRAGFEHGQQEKRFSKWVVA